MPEIFGADPAVGGRRRRLGEHQAGAADRPRTEMHQVPFVGKSVLARVLAHGRDDDPVGEGQVTKRDGIEEMGHGSKYGTLGLGGTGDWRLGAGAGAGIIDCAPFFWRSPLSVGPLTSAAIHHGCDSASRIVFGG